MGLSVHPHTRVRVCWRPLLASRSVLPRQQWLRRAAIDRPDLGQDERGLRGRVPVALRLAEQLHSTVSCRPAVNCCSSPPSGLQLPRCRPRVSTASEESAAIRRTGCVARTIVAMSSATLLHTGAIRAPCILSAVNNQRRRRCVGGAAVRGRRQCRWAGIFIGHVSSQRDATRRQHRARQTT